MAKPGIVYGNAMSSVAGFLFGASLLSKFDIKTCVGLLAGSSLGIACGCVINNYIDRDIDRKMARTKRRPLITGQIRPWEALAYAAALGLTGFVILYLTTNLPTMAVGVLGLFVYLVPYSIWKRRAPIGTVVGSISGATPILAGYTAATGRFDTAAALLFLSMMLWQMPHFYAIAMFRYDDYKRAGIPVLPVVKGMARTKREIMIYIVAFTLVACLQTAFGYTGYLYLVVIAGAGGFWFAKGWKSRLLLNDEQWGKSMFLFSLIALLVLSAMVAVGALLP